LVRLKSASSATSGFERRRPARFPYYVLCINSGEYKVMLQPGKAYKVIRPEKNDRPYQLRVIDEEGEDYLYPAEWFVPLELLPKQRRLVAAALAVTKP
jgi:hypothetical protein